MLRFCVIYKTKSFEEYMRIQIANRLKPFSHLPGTMCPLPGSSLRFQIFPACIKVHDLSQTEPLFLEELPLPVEGPIKDFTVQLDLERGYILVWGKSATGFFRYRIHAIESKSTESKLTKSKSKWGIIVEKSPNQKMEDIHPIGGFPIHQPSKTIERLSLGSHKEQDWLSVSRRQDLKEIFPFWFRLGQMITQVQSRSDFRQGTAFLLEKCREQIKVNNSSQWLEPFQNVFIAGFEGILSPRLRDDQYNGFHLPDLKKDCELSPFILLQEGSNLIRDLFIHNKNQEIHILPSLPSQFHCGRMTDLVCGSENLDLEWSKKELRRIVLRAGRTGDLQLIFPKGFRQYRLRLHPSDSSPGHSSSIVPCNRAIAIESEKTYFFDNFER